MWLWLMLGVPVLGSVPSVPRAEPAALSVFEALEEANACPAFASEVEPVLRPV